MTNEMWKLMTTNFSNRLMKQPMEEINWESPYRNLFDASELTEEELLSECIEVDGLHYLIDENHSGFLFLTDECAKQFNIDCGDNGDAEPIDWDIWCEPYELENYKDKGFMWNFDIMQCAGVYDSNGKQVKEAWDDDDVYIMNGIDEAMLNHPGCVVMGWCDG